MTTRRAKLFWNGRSQAVRLPAEFRFEGDEVEIRREGDEIVIAPLVRQRFERTFWRHVDELARGLELADAEPLGAGLLDVDVADSDE
ncbi:MAG: AbrB/MazE/SpoVT family DNA-binding domain-containing protein [Longimicrobiales bacterium]